MTQMKLFSWKNLLAVITFFFGIIICQYTGNRGILPIDSFSHFDAGYRILNGEHPTKDYWVVSGFFVDYLQSLIFYIFGINWQTYLLNASLLNGLVSLLFYILLNNLKLNFKISFFYAICFAILAYPSSGTPFVDHHSSFLSLIALLTLIYAIKTNKQYLWFLVPIFLFFAFLSKQVPATYILFVTIIVTILHILHQDKKKIIKIFLMLFTSTLISIFSFLIFLKINEIDIKFFLTQYFYYPSSIGQERFSTIDYDFKNTFLHFKFIYISLFILIFFTLNNLKNKKVNFYKDLSFKILLICIFSLISFVHHIIFTKNQIFIFFLIPFILSFASIQIKQSNYDYKKIINIFLILFCISLTFKYHLRFNVERKFHEMNDLQFSKALEAKLISKNFSGLNWITPNFLRQKIKKKEVIEEIDFLKDFNKILKLDKNNKAILTNYSFFSVINDEMISGYSRWYPGDNSAFPTKDSKYYKDYKELILSYIQKKKIKSVYILPDIDENNLLDYVNRKCLQKKKLDNDVIKYEIVINCQNLM
tara:strand:+ start:1420 stop:3021 length:1602 start_codon:yes stop_codon:yes gene_type:complete